MTDAMSVNECSEEFRTFFEQNYRLIFRSLLARTGSHSEAEDLTQETFVRAARYFGQSETSPSLQWLLTISANIFKNWLRYHQSVKRTGQELSIDENAPSLPSEQQSQENKIIAQQNMRLLSTAIKNLPSQMKRCFILFFIHKYKYEEIATLTGTSVQTVKSQISRGRKKVVESFQQVHDMDGRPS